MQLSNLPHNLQNVECKNLYFKQNSEELIKIGTKMWGHLRKILHVYFKITNNL